MSVCDAIKIEIDLMNPGQFFACCGLLELADRLWGAAEGWFDGTVFGLRPQGPVEAATATALLDSVVNCRLANTMTSRQLERLVELSMMTGSVRAKIIGLDEEKKTL